MHWRTAIPQVYVRGGSIDTQSRQAAAEWCKLIYFASKNSDT